jgi:hypothetical protein
MEHAIWRNKVGRDEYSSIHEIRKILGEAGARTECYTCASQACGVRMIPVFPVKLRLNGKEAHSSHFRASPEKHKTNCTGDGERMGVSDNPSIGESLTKPLHDLVHLGDYPMRYVRRLHTLRDAGSGGETVPVPRFPEVPRVPRTGERDHTSEPQTGHIRRLVEAYEKHPPELSRMKLRLPECPAKNYKEAFINVDQAVDERGRVKGSYVFYGIYGDHRRYPNDAISITFSFVTANHKKLGIWIKPELEPTANWKEGIAVLTRAKRESKALVYVIGRFRPFKQWKYSIEIEAFGDLWITFP